MSYRVYNVRVSAEDNELIEKEAKRLEIKPTTVFRSAAILELKRRREEAQRKGKPVKQAA